MTGVLNTAWGRSLFEKAYRFYKERLEAGPTEVLRNCVRPKTLVIDVGANIGFFTLQLASWVSEGGKVLALEPEALNYRRLQHAVAQAGLTDVVEAVQAAVSDVSGEGFLEINPGHPGDHKLGTTGVPVALVTIDELVAARGWPEVSLIKIDVQGAEMRVLDGARRTIERCRPALFIEVGDIYLRQYGSDSRELLTFCTDRGYTIHVRDEEGLSAPLSLDRALAIEEMGGYQDLLMLPGDGRVPNGARKPPQV